MLIFRVFIVAGLFSITSLAQADLVECDGIWKSSPCEGTQSKSISVVDRAKPAKTPGLENKRTLTHQFVTMAYQVKNKYGIEYPVRFVEQSCLAAETTFEDCKNTVNEHTRKIKEKIKLNTKTTDRQTNTDPISNSNTTNVVIINEGFEEPTASFAPLPIRKPHRPGPFKGYGSPERR